MTCNCPKCSYTTTNNTPMIIIRQYCRQSLVCVKNPSLLSYKPGVVLATTDFFGPNYLSINDDRWVRSSDGAVLTCEQLFDDLSVNNYELVVLTDYDFQDM